ncbi:hypothetical protein B0H10DRAFT_1941960 [Mycena sp. CBHHK59/15]|nr:hypothetical protein B0H10DRAFT_1941960 [Mycena sp. CBHHK59/15]
MHMVKSDVQRSAAVGARRNPEEGIVGVDNHTTLASSLPGDRNIGSVVRDTGCMDEAERWNQLDAGEGAVWACSTGAVPKAKRGEVDRGDGDERFIPPFQCRSTEFGAGRQNIGSVVRGMGCTGEAEI